MKPLRPLWWTDNWFINPRSGKSHHRFQAGKNATTCGLSGRTWDAVRRPSANICLNCLWSLETSHSIRFGPGEAAA